VQIFAILATEWVQRTTCLDRTVANQHLVYARKLIFSAPFVDAVVTETAAWLYRRQYPHDTATLRALHDALLQQIASDATPYWAASDTIEVEVGAFTGSVPESSQAKTAPQIINEALISARACHGPHRVRWFSVYDPDATATEAKPLDASQAEPLIHRMTQAELYFRAENDHLGAAMAAHQRALLQRPGIAEQCTTNVFVSSLCEAAELYADARDSQREMVCWASAAVA
jgi:hypothetical protein